MTKERGLNPKDCEHAIGYDTPHPEGPEYLVHIPSHNPQIPFNFCPWCGIRLTEQLTKETNNDTLQQDNEEHTL